MPTQLASDANMFSMIHCLLDEQDPLRAVERREGDRRPYDCSQLMAPYDGSSLPRQADFRLVKCQDLSPRGFSFLWPVRPFFEYVVIGLGSVPFSFFVAQVMNAQPAKGPADPTEAQSEYRVGCRFLNRLKA